MVQIPINKGTAGHVAQTGELVNMKDPYEHPLFNRKYEQLTDFRPAHLLAFPIKNGRDGVVGVVLILKKSGNHFTRLDEEVVTTLVLHCGVSIMLRDVSRSRARVSLANEILIHKFRVPESSIAEVLNCRIQHNLGATEDWRWPCREVPLREIPCLLLHMFESLGLIAACRIQRSTLVRFILRVEKGYRSVPYHNFLHAFSVTHFAYILMKQLSLVPRSMLTQLEAVSLIVSAICHDVDHRGINNDFQAKVKGTLAGLYGCEGAITERHHFAQALWVLNTEGCNIFEGLDTETYRRVLHLIRHCILASDLPTHLRETSQLQEMCSNFDPAQPQHRRLLLSMLMTAADLSDQVKGWRYCRNVSIAIIEENLTQSDLERDLGLPPTYDRHNFDIPTFELAIRNDEELNKLLSGVTIVQGGVLPDTLSQEDCKEGLSLLFRFLTNSPRIKFLEDVGLPCYQLVSRLFPMLDSCVRAVEDNIRRWHLAREWFALPENAHRLPLDVLKDPRLVTFVYKTETQT